MNGPARLGQPGTWPGPATLGVFLFLAPLTSARAHGAVAGMNSFYAGLFHPFQNLPHVLALAGLGIWLGQRPRARTGWPTLAFAVCAALALLLTTGIAGAPPELPVKAIATALISLALCFGVLIALALSGPQWLRSVLAGITAIMVALDSGVDGSPPWMTLALMLSGTWISASVLVANVAYYTSECPERQWLQIGIRVVGSWMAAASVLVLAFYIKGQTLA